MTGLRFWKNSSNLEKTSILLQKKLMIIVNTSSIQVSLFLNSKKPCQLAGSSRSRKLILKYATLFVFTAVISWSSLLRDYQSLESNGPDLLLLACWQAQYCQFKFLHIIVAACMHINTTNISQCLLETGLWGFYSVSVLTCVVFKNFLREELWPLLENVMLELWLERT